METCANCGRTIGRLETPHVFNEHVVCAACRETLIRYEAETLTMADAADAPGRSSEPLPQPVVPLNYQSPPMPEPPPAAVPVLFRYEAISVTTTHVRGPGGSLPIERVLSVKTVPAFVIGVVVEVYDLARRKTKFRFASRAFAAEFIAAIQQTKGSVTVERDDDFGGFIIWG